MTIHSSHTVGEYGFITISFMTLGESDQIPLGWPSQQELQHRCGKIIRDQLEYEVVNGDFYETLDNDGVGVGQSDHEREKHWTRCYTFTYEWGIVQCGNGRRVITSLKRLDKTQVTEKNRFWGCMKEAALKKGSGTHSAHLKSKVSDKDSDPLNVCSCSGKQPSVRSTSILNPSTEASLALEAQKEDSLRLCSSWCSMM